MGRITTLDGWRGLAILMVMVNHLASHTARPGYLHGIHVGKFPTSLGGFGVDVFFALSGYIITMRLLSESARTNAIDLSAFYVRRAFRILPPAIAYLLVVCLVGRLTHTSDFRWSNIAGSLFFYRNYQAWLGHADVYTAHFWSLAIEEHFYFLWPGVLALAGRRRAAWSAVVLASLCAAWRKYDLVHQTASHWHWIHPAGTDFPVRTDVRLDGLLLGAAFAILFSNSRVSSFVARIPSVWTIIAFVAALATVSLNHLYPSIVTYVLLAGAVSLSAAKHEGWAHSFLNLRPLVWIGQVSYSLYLWQQLFLLRPVDNSLPLGYFNRAPWNVLTAFLLASGSYYLLERPAISLGKQWHQNRFLRTTP